MFLLLNLILYFQSCESKLTQNRFVMTNFTLFYPLKTNGIFFKATYNKVRIAHCVYLGITDYNFQKYCIFSLKIDFVLANSVDLLGLYCLPTYPFRGSGPQRFNLHAQGETYRQEIILPCRRLHIQYQRHNVFTCKINWPANEILVLITLPSSQFSDESNAFGAYIHK